MVVVAVEEPLEAEERPGVVGVEFLEEMAEVEYLAA